MPFNPKTHNLLQSTDLSVALEKAVEHLDNSEREEPFVCVKADKPFALKMRFLRYIKAFKIQMKDKVEVDENKYDHLTFTESDTNEVIITSSLERDPLVLLTDEGNIL
tara:strand:+ start:1832 stop:2155 length:324 start_codon:yes stop_codon:yes gene_type:complete